MKPIQIEIGMSLAKNEQTTEIYNKFREYFDLKEGEDFQGFRYFIIKKPSEELNLIINDHLLAMGKERNRKENEFVEKVALDIFNNLTQEEKDDIWDNPSIATEHFGFCLWIRNKYIAPAKFDFDVERDSLSHDIGLRLLSLIFNYDNDNFFYHNLYGSFVFSYLRKLYYAFKDEYPDSIIKRYADLPDESIASEKCENKIKSFILNESRFKRLCKKYGLTEKQYKECKQVIDNYNKKNWAIAPYDIALLGSKKLEPEYRKKLLNITKVAFSKFARRLALELPTFVFNQKDAVLLAVEFEGSSLKRFPKFNSDDDVIKIVLKRDGKAIQYVKKELRENPEYIRLSLQHWYYSNSLQLRCMAKYRDNEEFIKIAIKSDGLNIKYASKRLRDNFEIAKLAIEHSPNNSVIKYLSPRLRDNIELALLDIKNGACPGIEYYSRRLRNCNEIAEALINSGHYVEISLFSKRIRNSDKIAELLISTGSGYKIDKMSERIRNSEKIAKALISAGCEEYLTYMSERIQKKYCKND